MEWLGLNLYQLIQSVIGLLRLGFLTDFQTALTQIFNNFLKGLTNTMAKIRIKAIKKRIAVIIITESLLLALFHHFEI